MDTNIRKVDPDLECLERMPVLLHPNGRNSVKIFGKQDVCKSRKRPRASARGYLSRKKVELAAQEKNFKVCDQLMEEITDLQSKRRILQSELRELQKKGEKG